MDEQTKRLLLRVADILDEHVCHRCAAHDECEQCPPPDVAAAIRQAIEEAE